MPSTPTIVVNAVILDHLDRTLITRRDDDGTWCLPGGFVEWGETVSEAIIREVYEEVGITISVDRIVGIYSENNIEIKPPAKTNSIILVFECSLLSGAPKISDEVSNFRFARQDELEQVLPRHMNRINDTLKRHKEIVLK